MQRDFHYSLVKVIAQSTGFTPDEAQVLAYASQYVDDAFDHRVMKINGDLQTAYPRYKDGYFDPICTAHSGFQMLQGFHKDIQRKVYIPFHFLPYASYRGDGFYDYSTVPNGSLAQEVVGNALAELKINIGEQRIQKLIKLGISLHTYADTWAHQMFSGRYNSGDNDIEDIHIEEDGHWEKIGKIKQFQLNMLPDIGHAEAFELPDQSHIHWRYRHYKTGKIVERNNTEVFLQAGKSIFSLFSTDEEKWNEISTKFRKILSIPTKEIEEKELHYTKEFPQIYFKYDKEEWRNDALNSPFGQNPDIQEQKEQKKLHSGQTSASELPQYEILSDRKWFYFHLEAYHQREYVLERIRMDLL